MGRRGPLPKRGLARRKSRQQAIDQATTVGRIEVDIPAPYEASEKWHPIAFELFEAAQKSGQSEFYTQTDWVKLYLLCEQITRELQPQFVGFAEEQRVETVNGQEVLVAYQKPIAGTVPMKGASLNAIQAMMASLGISEGDRRRMNIELQHGQQSSEDEAARQAREDAEMMEAMRTGGNVVPIRQASGD